MARTAVHNVLAAAAAVAGQGRGRQQQSCLRSTHQVAMPWPNDLPHLKASRRVACFTGPSRLHYCSAAPVGQATVRPSHPIRTTLPSAPPLLPSALLTTPRGASAHVRRGMPTPRSGLQQGAGQAEGRKGDGGWDLRRQLSDSGSCLGQGVHNCDLCQQVSCTSAYARRHPHHGTCPQLHECAHTCMNTVLRYARGPHTHA